MLAPTEWQNSITVCEKHRAGVESCSSVLMVRTTVKIADRLWILISSVIFSYNGNEGMISSSAISPKRKTSPFLKRGVPYFQLEHTGIFPGMRLPSRTILVAFRLRAVLILSGSKPFPVSAK